MPIHWSWTWLKTESIGMFSLEAMHSFTVAKKDVIYDNLKREVVNWCRLHCQSLRPLTTSKFSVFVQSIDLLNIFYVSFR